MSPVGSQSMVARLRRVIVKRPEEAFRSREHIDREWQDLNYVRPPDLDRSAREHNAFVQLMKDAGADVLYLPTDDRTGLDSLYAHDPVLITDRGAIIFQTGKVARRGEGLACADAFRSWDVPFVGVIDGRQRQKPVTWSGSITIRCSSARFPDECARDRKAVGVAQSVGSHSDSMRTAVLEWSR
jgi:N-dimethylarginine dimethylaminohydrolase